MFLGRSAAHMKSTVSIARPAVVRFCCFSFALLLAAISVKVASWAEARRPADAGIFGLPPVKNSSQLPVGLIIPVSLEKALELKNTHKGEPLEARVMQDVPLPDRGKIAINSKVRGTVLSVVKDSDGSGVSLTLAFTQAEDRKVNLTMNTSLRAIASYTEVRRAKAPWTGSDNGTPAGWDNTTQIGGDIRYGDGGLVRSRKKQKVGKGVLNGVLVHLQPNPPNGCEGPVNGDDHLQALWVFSADACGVYGMKGATIGHNGKSEPIGEITLHFEKDDARLESGAALLLRVVDHP
jgi:hypothetical protein